MNYYTVYTTFSSKEEAKELGNKIVKNKLGACVQIFKIELSIYEWEGKLEQEEEYGMFIKTTESKVNDLMKFIEENHSYEVPQILVYRIDKGNEDYLNFIEKTVGRKNG